MQWSPTDKTETIKISTFSKDADDAKKMTVMELEQTIPIGTGLFAAAAMFLGFRDYFLNTLHSTGYEEGFESTARESERILKQWTDTVQQVREKREEDGSENIPKTSGKDS